MPTGAARDRLLMTGTTIAPLAVTRRIAFDSLTGFSRLFRHYAEGDEAALAYFAHDWRASRDLDAAAEAAANHPRNRALLAEVLLEQNSHWGNDGPEALSNIEALRQPGSAAVVTGQQLGLFGGPLYTLYKAATAVQLASRESERTGRTVVPVFWMADEDHDWDEVRHTHFLRGSRVRTVSLPADTDRQPVGRRRVGDETAAALRELEAELPPTEHTTDLMRLLHRCYAAGVPVRDAFARFLVHLFRGTGLVLISSDDARLKREGAEIFRRELEDPSATLGLLLAASRDLEADGFHAQVAPMAGNAFIIEPEGRFPLDPAGGDRFVARGLGRSYSLAELLSRLADEPQDFSANVVLRPVLEDRLLPTMAYVAGPGEAAYYAQLRGVYEHFGVPMPVVFPRGSITLVQPGIRRILDRYNLKIEDFDDRTASGPAEEALFTRLALEAGDQPIEQTFERAVREIDAVATGLGPLASAVDSTLFESVEALRTRLARELKRSEKKVIRAEKRRHADIRTDIEKAASHLFPAGKLQERVLSPIYLLNAFGPRVVDHLLAVMELDTSDHFVVDL